MSQPSLKQIADVFVRYANFTLGGGSATTAVIHGEIVGKRHWVSEEQFALSFALGRLTPGTNVLAFCVGIGWMLRRWSGAVVALLASSIPCTLIVIAITVLFGRGCRLACDDHACAIDHSAGTLRRAADGEPSRQVDLANHRHRQRRPVAC
jgi:chromate transport protein ChrA